VREVSVMMLMSILLLSMELVSVDGVVLNLKKKRHYRPKNQPVFISGEERQERSDEAWVPVHPARFLDQKPSQRIFQSTSNVVSAGTCDCPDGCQEPCKLTAYNTCWSAHCHFSDDEKNSDTINNDNDEKNLLDVGDNEYYSDMNYNDENNYSISDDDNYYADNEVDRKMEQQQPLLLESPSFSAHHAPLTDEYVEYQS